VLNAMRQLFVTHLPISSIGKMHVFFKMVEFGPRCSCKSYTLGIISKYFLQLRDKNFCTFLSNFHSKLTATFFIIYIKILFWIVLIISMKYYLNHISEHHTMSLVNNLI
jgi:hypothetical protein